MARVGLTKITPIKSIEEKTIEIQGQVITVRQYLPMSEKSHFLSDALSDIVELNGQNSPLREDIYFSLYLIKYYTNINLTETMLNDAAKTYDLLHMNHIFEEVIKNIPADEYQTMFNYLHSSIDYLIQYRTSLAGIMEVIQQNQNAETKNVDEIVKQLQELGNDSTLAQVLQHLA